VPTARLAVLADLLAPDERARAARFVRRVDGDRFTAARAALRLILGGYLDRSPTGLNFRYECHCGRPTCRHEHRKPRLASTEGGDWLCFNLSHAHNLALLAVSVRREVGVDLEWIDPAADIEGLARGAFAPSELAVLAALPVAERRAAFFAAWTRKEAYAKAVGRGFSLAPEQIIVSLTRSAQLIAVPGGTTELVRWWLAALTPAPGFAGTLAVERGPAELVAWHYQP
jgi:4'-phosphopantetheinyl transferase